jgi:hypothetical protein
MAQTNFTPIQIYSSTTVAAAPVAGDLVNSTLGSELAINITDGKLFYKDNTNAVQVIAWKTTPTTAGGTGLTSYTAGDIVYYASGTTFTKLAIGAAGRYLSSTGSAPQWSAPAALTKTDDTNVTLTLGGSASTALLNAASLTLGWTGQLSVARGGTGASTFTSGTILYGNGTSAIATSANLTWDNTNLAVTGNLVANSGFVTCNAGSGAAYSSKLSTAYNFPNVDTFLDSIGGTSYDGQIIFRTSTNGGAMSEGMRLNALNYLLVGYTGSNGAYKLQVNSQIFATSSTIATSDANYKTNTNPLENALELINSLNPVSFNWKPHPVHDFDTTTLTTGFLAQQVKEALKDKPYVNSIVKSNTVVLEKAKYDNEGKLLKEAVTEDFLGLAEGNMIALLTAAIKELSAKFDNYVKTHP